MSDVWPPANFSDWPSTRIVALVVDGIILLLMILPPTRRFIFTNPWDECCCCHELIKAAVLGALIGMFFHFIPCIWWTCDWGEYDGQAVRGAIWFIGGPIIGLGILWWECKRSKQTETEAINDAMDLPA